MSDERERIKQALLEIDARRLQGFINNQNGSRSEQLTAMADAVTKADLATIRQATEMLDEMATVLLRVSNDLERDYAKGLRCGVCGMTPAQSKAINYNCAWEC